MDRWAGATRSASIRTPEFGQDGREVLSDAAHDGWVYSLRSARGQLTRSTRRPRVLAGFWINGPDEDGPSGSDGAWCAEHHGRELPGVGGGAAAAARTHSRTQTHQNSPFSRASHLSPIHIACPTHRSFVVWVF